MRNFIVIGLLVYSLFCGLHFVDAKVSQEWIQWTRGEFEVPSEIQEAKNVSAVRPFLNSETEFTRMAAVRRLGEVGGEQVITLLEEIFKKEPYENLMPPEGIPIVKLEIIRTLERIGGDKAKSALLDILKKYWESGPKVKDKNILMTTGILQL
ncbi:hypothetical protein COS16_07310 [Candidatus Desantisbacteria bacterium CG02_land_8_20_14_3_00_49_13]|nr:MAG: hypothetical protein COS16_07310 [Candidatus Desantisbacteria bacterium CG02_land_8_20_14_3_00_49_13]